MNKNKCSEIGYHRRRRKRRAGKKNSRDSVGEATVIDDVTSSFKSRAHCVTHFVISFGSTFFFLPAAFVKTLRFARGVKPEQKKKPTDCKKKKSNEGKKKTHVKRERAKRRKVKRGEYEGDKKWPAKASGEETREAILSADNYVRAYRVAQRAGTSATLRAN